MDYRIGRRILATLAATSVLLLAACQGDEPDIHTGPPGQDPDAVAACTADGHHTTQYNTTTGHWVCVAVNVPPKTAQGPTKAVATNAPAKTLPPIGVSPTTAKKKTTSTTKAKAKKKTK